MSDQKPEPYLIFGCLSSSPELVIDIGKLNAESYLITIKEGDAVIKMSVARFARILAAGVAAEVK